MNEILNRLSENNLNDFKGLSIVGELPVPEDVLNDVIGLIMGSFTNKPASKTEGSVHATGESPDFSKIMNSLDEKEVKIEFQEKRAVVKVNIRKY